MTIKPHYYYVVKKIKRNEILLRHRHCINTNEHVRRWLSNSFVCFSWTRNKNLFFIHQILICAQWNEKTKWKHENKLTANKSRRIERISFFVVERKRMNNKFKKQNKIKELKEKHSSLNQINIMNKTIWSRLLCTFNRCLYLEIYNGIFDASVFLLCYR